MTSGIITPVPLFVVSWGSSISRELAQGVLTLAQAVDQYCLTMFAVMALNYIFGIANTMGGKVETLTVATMKISVLTAPHVRIFELPSLICRAFNF